MKIYSVFVVVILVLLGPSMTNARPVNPSNATSNNTRDGQEKHHKAEIKVATVDFERIKWPFMIMVWILVASFAKLGFHLSARLSSIFPESSLVICLGIIIGIIIRISQVEVQVFNSRTFFLFMLPPIVLEAGYFLQDKAFFDNIGTILLNAVLGTLFNAFTVGFSLYGVTSSLDVETSLMHCLVFGALIAAVDPVAVLAVFEEVKVNVMLYILVFGESLLNDAVTVVLYHMFENMALIGVVTYKEVFLGIANFLVVSIGGTVMGLFWGLATGIVTKYTDHVRVIEPIFVLVMSYLSYLSAEIFHFSGIMSIITCAIIMKPYVERNISRKSHTTLKYVMKMLSSCSETLIFMFLGTTLITYPHSWHTAFVLWTLLFVTVFRAIGVICLTFLANRFGRLNKLSVVDQFVMSYGGIRGAVSFSLAILLSKDHFPEKEILVTTTLVVVMFTVFIQGTTIKPLVKLLQVRLQTSHPADMYRQLNDKLLDHLVAGMEEVTGHHGHSYYWQLCEHLHNRYLRRWMVRENESIVHDEDILLAYRKLEYKDALKYLEREGSGSLLLPSASGHHLQALAHTSVANSEGIGDNEPLLRAGAFLRVPDIVVRDSRATEPSEGIMEISDTPLMDMHNLTNLLVRSRKTFRPHRKFQRNNLLEDDVDDMLSSHRLSPYHSQPLRFKVPQLAPEATKPKHKHHHRHHHHHRKRRRGKGQELEGFPPKKKLSTIFEPSEEDESKGDEKEKEALAERETTRQMNENDEGISFKAGQVRWKIGRQVSEEDPDKMHRALGRVKSPEKITESKNETNSDDESSSSSSSDDDSSTGDELDKNATSEATPNGKDKSKTKDSKNDSPSSSEEKDVENTSKTKRDEDDDENHGESIPLVDIIVSSL